MTGGKLQNNLLKSTAKKLTIRHSIDYNRVMMSRIKASRFFIAFLITLFALQTGLVSASIGKGRDCDSHIGMQDKPATQMHGDEQQKHCDAMLAKQSANKCLTASSELTPTIKKLPGNLLQGHEHHANTDTSPSCGDVCDCCKVHQSMALTLDILETQHSTNHQLHLPINIGQPVAYTDRLLRPPSSSDFA